MTERTAPKLTFWPFVLMDILFLGLAYLIFSVSHRPLTFWEAFGLIVSAGLGAWSFLTPFLQRNAAELKLAEAGNLANSIAQIQNLDRIAAQLSGATQHLQTAQEQSSKTVTASKQIADRMAEESRAFSEFIQKANDSEKGHLRLEVEKLRRAEADWLQILVHILDHIFALNQAAVMSGKPALIEQIGNFQNVCRDAARRIGLVCHVPDGLSGFDEKLHQVLAEQPKPENGARLTETLATGYSYQGRVVRRALVKVESEPVDKSEKDTAAEPQTAQETLL